MTMVLWAVLASIHLEVIRMGVRVRQVLTLITGLVLFGLPAACIPVPGQSSSVIRVASDRQAQYVVAGAAWPEALAFHEDGRVFYAEKNTGRIRLIVDGVLQEEPFATVPVNMAGDRGLLGLALHPRFDVKPRLYVFYSRSDTGAATDNLEAVIDNRVVYFEVDGNVAGGGEIFVASLPVLGAGRRVGGQIAFSDDDRLYVALGDLNTPDDAQRMDTLAGKVLRYDDAGQVPADNPIADSPIFALGIRHPQGLTIDPESRLPLLTDRSAEQYHEVNVIQAGGNYGWPVVNGLATTPEELAFVAETPDYVDPILDSGTAGSPLVGAGVNPSTKYGANQRLRFFYGQRDTGQLISLGLTGDRTQAGGTQLFAQGLPAGITDVAFTPAGTLYVATESAVLRVVPFP
jgi:glucose/arabinose dehydrogenase